jgi:hypothetical protein
MRKLFLFLIVTAISACSYAQSKAGIDLGNAGSRSYKICMGPVVGVNYSTLSGNPDGIDMGAKGSTGFHGGIAANIHFGRNNGTGKGGTGLFGIQMEALYSQHTIKTDGSDNLELSFIEVPVLAQFYVYKGLSLEVGPTFALNTSSKPDNLSFSNIGGFATKNLKANDVRLTFGAQYSLNCGLNFAARYNLGNSDIAGNMPCKVNALQISIGWMFTVAK